MSAPALLATTDCSRCLVRLSVCRRLARMTIWCHYIIIIILINIIIINCDTWTTTTNAQTVYDELNDCKQRQLPAASPSQERNQRTVQERERGGGAASKCLIVHKFIHLGGGHCLFARHQQRRRRRQPTTKLFARWFGCGCLRARQPQRRETSAAMRLRCVMGFARQDARGDHEMRWIPNREPNLT